MIGFENLRSGLYLLIAYCYILFSLYLPRRLEEVISRNRMGTMSAQNSSPGGRSDTWLILNGMVGPLSTVLVRICMISTFLFAGVRCKSMAW